MLLTGWQLLIGGCFLLGVGTVGGGALGRVTLGGVLLLGYMIALSAAAFTIWTALLGKFPVGKVSLFGSCSARISSPYAIWRRLCWSAEVLRSQTLQVRKNNTADGIAVHKGLIYGI